MNWYAEANAKGFKEVAESLGMVEQKKSWGPCPSCCSNKRSSSDNRPPIGVTENISWKCFSCGIKGDVPILISLSLFKKSTKQLDSSDFDSLNVWLKDHDFNMKNRRVKTTNLQFQTVDTSPVSSPPEKFSGDFAWRDGLAEECKKRLYSSEGMPVFNYLTLSRKISKEVIDKADLGCLKVRDDYYLSIPLKDKDGTIVNIRFRSVPPAKKSYRVCSGRPLPLYGADSLADKRSDVIIVEGELDVLALNTYGFTKNVVSGTSGAAANWTDEWLDQLEDFKQFLLWFDNDKAGDDGADKLSKKLGEYRCFRIKSSWNDVGEALANNLSGDDIDQIMINDVISYTKANLVNASFYTDAIEDLINNPDSLKGITTTSQKLDSVLGGIASGLWVVTGDTGHGKTTWCTWLCYQQAKNGVPVMLTSFEQRPIGTVQKLLRSELGGDFTKFTPDERREALDNIGKLPLHIYDHYGEITFDNIITQLRFAVRRHGVKIALVDHLGFLTQPDSKQDERILIEKVVRKLATVAIQDDFTIILVCHPNNMSVSQQRRVKISDLKGASAIRQDAHVALVVERQDGTAERGFPATTIYADKIRSEFGSNGGHVTMAFDPYACIYADRWEDTPSCQNGANIVVPDNPTKKRRRVKK